MGKPRGISFRFEKNKLIQRTKHIEIWEGLLDGQSHLVKRFCSRRGNHWNEYAFLSSIQHSILLKPSTAGFTKDGSFCYGMPIDFVPSKPESVSNLPLLTIQLLSLIRALEARKMRIHWNPHHFVSDAKSGRIFVAGVNPVNGKSRPKNGVHHLALLSKYITDRTSADQELLKTIRKWMRRKENQLDGCLHELISCHGSNLDQTILSFEWPFSRELELAAGIYRMAEQGRGRCLLFYGEPGEGKSTLLRQFSRELSARGATPIFYVAIKEERPFHSVRNLLRFIEQSTGTFQQFPKQINEDTMTDFAVKLLRKPGTVSVIILDNLHDCDVFSRRCLARIFKQASDLPVLFLVSAENCLKELAENAVSLPIQKPALKQVEDSIEIPFWQEKQRKSYFQQIYQHTSANPLFFHEYLSEAIHQRQSQLKWSDGEWSFLETRIPDFPDVLLDFYTKNAPTLSEKEKRLLQVAAVHGDLFEVSPQEQKIAASLVKKNLLTDQNGQFRFRNPLFSEAIAQQLEPNELRSIHKTLAQQLSRRVTDDSMIVLARHYLKAGMPAAALQWTCKAIQQLGSQVEMLALSIFEELELQAAEFNVSQKIALFQQQGGLYHRRGKFVLAASSYEKAAEFAGGNAALYFDLCLSLVECYLLQENILSAQQVLNALGSRLTEIHDESTLFRFLYRKEFQRTIVGLEKMNTFRRHSL
jgi:AAA ATPase domain